MNDSGQWADASGNTYNVEHPLDEVTVMPGEFKEQIGRFDIGRNPRKVHANEYSSEVQRLASRRGTPRIGDMRLLEKQTGLDSKTYSVFKGNVIKNAMKLAAHGYGLNTNVFGYGIPEK